MPGFRVVLRFAVAAVIACSAVQSAAGQAFARSEIKPPATELTGTRWRFVRYTGGDGSVIKADGRVYSLSFAKNGKTQVRFDCNKGSGTWSSSEPGQLNLGPVALTRMMCPPGSNDSLFIRQWEHISNYVLRDGRLYLSVAADGGVFEFRPAKSDNGRHKSRQKDGAAAAQSELTGTRWQFVRFEGGDGAVKLPEGRLYTVEFAAEGRVSVRFDCNRGAGSWKSEGPGHLEFGPAATTLMACPDGSLDSFFGKQWGHIRSYVLRDGRLYLALMADGGIFEFDPLTE